MSICFKAAKIQNDKNPSTVEHLEDKIRGLKMERKQGEARPSNHWLSLPVPAS